MPLLLQTDYALRTLIYLAGRPGRATVDQVAEFYRISVHHVAKVVNLLARRGYVRSIRGVGGGLELARDPAEVRLGDVVQEFEGGMDLLKCVSTENVCVIQPACKLRRVLGEAERVQREFLNRYRLCDVVRPSGNLTEFRLVPPEQLRRPAARPRRQPRRGPA